MCDSQNSRSVWTIDVESLFGIAQVQRPIGGAVLREGGKDFWRMM